MREVGTVHEAREQAKADVALLEQFIGRSQLGAIRDGLRGEEREFFQDKMASLSDLIRAMPKTYEQDGLGEEAVVHLHYFKGNQDWWITEKDCDPDGEGQVQAFGLVDLGFGEPELGYISIKELVQYGIELDLYWTAKTVGQVKAKL